MFYSRQGLKNICYSLTWTGHKRTLQHKASTVKKLLNTSTKGDMSTKYQWALIQNKWLSFHYLASIPLMPRVQQFFLTKSGITPS